MELLSLNISSQINPIDVADFVSAAKTVEFPKLTSQICVMFDIVDNKVIEDTETFEVTISTDDPLVIKPDEALQVRIIDDDSKLFKGIINVV